MKRPLLTWLVFAACALIGLGVLGWFSAEMLRLERGAAQAREIAVREENVRLALWRMDSALASVHGLEAARPVGDYEPFVRTGATFTIDFRQNAPSSVLVPSPLLGFTPPFVRLHLQLQEDGRITSPQVPEGPAYTAALEAQVPGESMTSAAVRLRQLRGSETSTALLEAASIAPFSIALRDDGAPAAVPTSAPAEFAQQLAPQAERQATVELKKSQAELQQRNVLAEENYYTVNRAAPPRARPVERTFVATDEALEVADGFRRGGVAPRGHESPAPAGAAPTASFEAEQPIALDIPRQDMSQREFAAQAAAAPSVVSGAVAERDQAVAGVARAKGKAESDEGRPPFAPDDEPVTGTIDARWIGDELFFLRPVSGSAQVRAQAVWLDWPELRAWLLARVTDLLPGAALEPVDSNAAFTLDDASRRLAFLPVRLRPGPVALTATSSWSPLQVSLVIAWVLAGVGVVALALLLSGTLRLSERRGAFVSAVTHELRTPLTTFRMYTEMLSSGMVPDEGKRRSYLDTLRKEAERLSHLVENVLSYARLERGRASRRIEDTTPGDLFARIEERLRQRAEQGGLALTIGFEAGAAERPLRTDTTAFEQIVFNLVDNAAKYARRPEGGGTLAIQVAAGSQGRVITRVSDDGPGIAASVRKRLFQPFSKSAAEAAHSQPGVGLGLALSRRLARDELHGELALERTGPEGTVFRLEV